MLKLILFLLLATTAESLSAGLRRHGRVKRVLNSHAAAAAAATAAAATAASTAATSSSSSSTHSTQKVDPPIAVTEQTGHSAMNPQTAQADADLPAKYTMHSVPLMDDSFTSTETMQRDWVVPKNAPVDQIGFEQPVGAKPSLWFSGHFVGLTPLRSKQTYEWPFTVVAQVDRSHACSDHFIMISTRSDIKFSWGNVPGVITFAQNCQTKTIYSNNMDGTPHEAKATASPKLGPYTWDIVVSDLTITFKDNLGEPVVVPNHLGRDPLYIYIGADQDDSREKSRFYKVMVMAPPKAKSLGADVVMGDDFQFLNDTRPKEWTRQISDSTQVDHGCGGMNQDNTPSFRFQGPVREATSKMFDFHRGGVVETCVRYGSTEADNSVNADDKHTCSPMNDRDGMALQASTDGVTFTNVLRLIAGQFPELQSANFTCMKTMISPKAYPQFMSSTLWLRWKQISDLDMAVKALYKNHQVRGNWALGRVRAIGAPEPAKKLIMEDKMLLQRPSLWSYPAHSSKCPQWGINADKKGWWMGGQKLNGCEMSRTMQMFQGQIVMEMDVAKTSKCSSQVVVVSTSKMLEYNPKGMANTFVFGWDCDSKFIMGPQYSKNKENVLPPPQKVTTKCQRKTHYKVTIKIENGAVLMLDDRCDALSLPIAPKDTPYFVHIGASNPIAESRSTFSNLKIFQQVDVLGNGFGNIFEESLVKDDFAGKARKMTSAGFDLTSIDATQWVPMVIREDPMTNSSTKSLAAPPTMGFDNVLGAKQGQWFTGVFGGDTPIRTIKSFNFPFAVRSQILKDAKCNNHFVVITSDPEERWSWGEESDAVKIGWNCDTKYIAGTDPKSSVSVPCNKKGTIDMDIKIFEGMISFTDDVCGTLSTINPLSVSDPEIELYVYYGADVDSNAEDGSDIKTTWKSFEVTGPERPPQVDNRRVLMQDDFNFHNDLYQPQWDMETTTGQSDQICGSVEGNSLHFGNTGARMATTKPVDASKGARLEFAIRFGGSSMQCGKFIDPKDGVEVQYSVDEGTSWKKLVRYTSEKFPKFVNNFNEINNIVIDDQQFADALTKTTMFRWTSINTKNRPCCGHWALDNVRIVSLETQGDMVVDDLFNKGENNTAWTYSSSNANPSSCKIGLDKKMLEFHGDCSRQAEQEPTFIKNNRPLNGAAGVVVEAELKKDWKCSNHVIAISNQNQVTFKNDVAQNSMVKMGWDCGNKYIQTPSGIISTPCSELRKYKTLIRIEDGFIEFQDDVCAPLKIKIPNSMSDGLFHVFLGSTQDITKGLPTFTTKYTSFKIEQEVPSPYDSFTAPIIVDDFSEEHPKDWQYPNATQNGGNCTFREDEHTGAAIFGGDCTDTNPLRMKDSLPTPFNVIADIEKTTKCSNQYIMLSPKRGEKFNFETDFGIVSMGWNCNEKFLQSSTKDKNALMKLSVNATNATNATIPERNIDRESIDCPNIGANKMTVKVQSGVISFKDSSCNTLVLKNPYPVGTELYVYVGANPIDTSEVDSTYLESSFTLLTVEGPARPPKLDDLVKMYDGFDYRNEIYPPMWTMSETTGRADQECGSKSGNSLRFFNPGVRVATTKPVDIRNGGDLKFYIRMGGSDGPACKKMSLLYKNGIKKLQDGIRVQFTHEPAAAASLLEIDQQEPNEDPTLHSDTKHTLSNLTDASTGVVWTDLAEYTVMQYSRTMGEEWIKIHIPMDYDTNFEAMGKNVRIRWIQNNQDAQACCDHWALDEIEIKAHPIPTRGNLNADFLIRDTFVSEKYGPNPVFWNMYDTSGRSGTIPSAKAACDVRPAKAKEDARKILRFDNDGPRIATTKTLDFKKGNGASVTFFLSFATSGATAMKTNVSNTIPVVLEFSTDQGNAWETLASYSPLEYPDSLEGCERIHEIIDSDNNTNAFLDNIVFRWSQAPTPAPNALTGDVDTPLRLSWSMDGLEVRTGALRIGFEDYDLKAINQHKWCYQPENTIAPYNYTYSKLGHLSFSGNANQQGTVRTHMSFNAPLVVEADVERSSTCSNHFIALSSKKYFTWSWTPDEESIKMVYHCNEKLIIYGTPGSSESVYSTPNQCTAKGDFKLQVKVKGNTVTFVDNNCEIISIQVDPAVLSNFYVYVGAAQPVTSYDMEKLEVLPHISAKDRGAKCSRIKCVGNVQQPVCGSDGITYDSYCKLSIATCKNNVQKVKLGKCDPLEPQPPSLFKDISITGRGSVAVHKDDGTKMCPIKQDCEVGEWSEWSNCSTTCGEGVNIRNRTVLVTPMNTGTACPVLAETRVCNLRKCDCGVSEWSEYGKCDVPCGGGKSFRHRDIHRQPLRHGLQCPALNESRTCNSKACARVGLPVVPERIKKMLHEQKAELFTRIDRSSGGWCYPDAGELAPYATGYTGNMGGVWFSGDGSDRSSMRTHQSFATDHHDLFIQAEISKNSECSNHFIVLTDNDYYRWSWEPEPNTFKMVWNCDQKTIIYPNGKKSTKCGELKNYNLGIHVHENKVIFEDDTCEDVVAPEGPTAKDMFVYIGANYAEKNSTVATGTKTTEEQAMVETSFLQRNVRRLRLSARALSRSKATGSCGSETIPWNEVGCDSKTGAVLSKNGNAKKCMTTDTMLLKGKDGKSYFDVNRLKEKVKECEDTEECVGLQYILHAPKIPGRYSLRSGYDMQIAPADGDNREGSFCPKVGAEEIIKVTQQDVDISAGKVDGDEELDSEEDDDTERNDDRRPAPGWIKATDLGLNKLPVQDEDLKYEYRFKKGNAWYISPPTSRIWDWNTFNTISGTWIYGDSDGNNGDFECIGGADVTTKDSCGLGCSTGGGKKFKVLARCTGGKGFDVKLDRGTVSVCQDRPNAFEGKACHNDVQISYYAIPKVVKSTAEKAEEEEKLRLKAQKEEEDIILDGESTVADEALQSAETPPENAEDQIENEPNRAVFKMFRISGMDSVTNRIKGTGLCPHIVDCVVGDWGDWSNCSLPCDGGNTTRSRIVEVTPEYGGLACPDTAETKICNTRECDCGVSNFTGWSECSQECGVGSQTRSRTIFREPLGDGAVCPVLNESESCNEHECAVVGLPSLGSTLVNLENAKSFDFFNAGSEFNTTEEFCTQRSETIFPYEYKFTKNVGLNFKGDAMGRGTVRSRQTFRLPLRLDVSFQRNERCSNHYIVLTTDEYFMWSGNTQERNTIKFFYNCDTRTILAPARPSSTNTKGGLYTKKCQRHLLPDMTATIDLNFAKSYLTDNTCGETDISWMDILGNFAGKDLYLYIGGARPKVPWTDKGSTVFTSLRVSGDGSVINTINGTGACPNRQDCVVTPWTEYSECTAPCNGGNHSRTRAVVKEPAFKGKACPELVQEDQCNTQHCGVDCVVTDFTEWSNCSKVCGGGVATRSREIFVDVLNGTLYGKEQCPALSESKKCNEQICGVDCVVSEFAPWSACSAPCGGGGKKRIRSVLVEPVTGSHHGKQCPHLEETEPCNQQKCPQHKGPTPIYESKCSALKGQCNACTNDPDCGYCPTTGECFLGNPDGPLPRFNGDISFLTDPQKYFMYLTNCSSYQFAFCAQTPCEEYSDCSQCMADSFCGWCAGSNKCAEGDAAGSFQEFCPRGWIHSPMHSGVGVRHRSDLLLTSRQVAAERDRLGDFCEANTEEQRRAIQEQMEDEKTRNQRLLRLQQSCSPCEGVWPNCQCEPDGFPLQLRPLEEEQVARAAVTEEANGKQDPPPLKANGVVCMLDDKCASGTCVDRCCNEEVNGCNGHGKCDEKGGCACEEGFTGLSCEVEERTSEEVDKKDGDNSAALAEEKQKAQERAAKKAEELDKSKQREEVKKQEIAKKEEENQKQMQKIEEDEKEKIKMEEAAKAGDAEAGVKSKQKQEEIEKQKQKEELFKTRQEEEKKQSSEELEKQNKLQPEEEVDQVDEVEAVMNSTVPQENMTVAEAGEMQVKELMLNLTKPGADVPKIAQSIITVGYNNSANVAAEEALTLEQQSNDKYSSIVEQKRELEKTIAAEETVKGAIKSKEVETKENQLAAEKVERAQKLVVENEIAAKEMAAVQEKKAISDENAAGAKAEMAKLQLQRETSAAKAEQNANDAAVLAADMAKQTLEQEADKKKETAEALAKEQAVTDLKALHTQTDLAREAARKEELSKEIEDSDASSSALNVDASNQQSDKVLRQGVVEKAESAVKSY